MARSLAGGAERGAAGLGPRGASEVAASGASRGRSKRRLALRCADPGADRPLNVDELLDFITITSSASPLEAERLHLSGKRA